ncbi:hypothetical protein KCMC57_up36150 [Kitasatospora sp. CMC57]|uniref:Uncharacterized protein n=1 Tax=Kitasatospora sp. CMC57 TaxID=3231513 RepID=A0AB33K5S1_9ACTN
MLTPVIAKDSRANRPVSVKASAPGAANRRRYEANTELLEWARGVHPAWRGWGDPVQHLFGPIDMLLLSMA